jgi:hypothetical protein
MAERALKAQGANTLNPGGSHFVQAFTAERDMFSRQLV